MWVPTAVIPAPLVYVTVAAVITLVVGFQPKTVVPPLRCEHFC